MASAGARAYNGGLGAVPPAGSRGRAPGQGVRGAKPPEAESFLAFQRPMKSAKLMKFTVIVINFAAFTGAEKLKFFTVSDKPSVCDVYYIECDSKFFPLKDWRIEASEGDGTRGFRRDSNDISRM